MAGFSLRGGGGGGGGRGGDRGGDHPIGADSLFLYARGAAAAAADTAASGGGGGGGIGFQLWHPHQQAAAAAAAVPHTSQFFSSGAVATGVVLGFSSHDGGAGGIGGPGGAGAGRAGTSCQDCGNNAKKDCAHMRCRTCCRSRGFSCPTHVKSTWVPAAKRRERQQQLAALFRGAANSNSASAAAAAAAAAAASKRPRELVRSLGRLPSANSAMVTTTTSSGDGGGGRFPPELNVEAVFRCVRIGAVDEPEAELAYQTAVSIGGHTFKGILRDHGPADDAAVGQLPPSSAEYHHQLTAGQAREGSSPAGSSEAAATVATSAAVLMDPYPTPIGAFAAGTQFFPHNPRT